MERKWTLVKEASDNPLLTLYRCVLVPVEREYCNGCRVMIVEGNCFCDWDKKAVITPPEPVQRMMSRDLICRICRTSEVNHTAWLCDKCSQEAVDRINRKKDNGRREGLDSPTVGSDMPELWGQTYPIPDQSRR